MSSLVIQLARMGDLLQTRRLMLSLKEEGDVHLCVDQSLTEFAAFLYPFAKVHAVRAHLGSGMDDEFVQVNRTIFKQLKNIPFKAVYNLNYSGLSLAMSTIFPTSVMRGHWLDQGQVLRSSWMNLAFRWSSERRSSPLNLMDFWAFLAPNPVAPSKVNPNPVPKGGGLGVVLAGRMARRSIPPQLWAKCVAAVSQRLGNPSIFLLGGKQEQAVAKEIIRSLSPALSCKTKNLAGKTSLLELAKLIESLDLVISPDTGTMHMAAALGVPVEAFFLSSAWCSETGPYGEGHRVWQAVQSCLPCLESQPCPYDVKCLNPFAQNEFLNILSRDKANSKLAIPNGLMCLSSRLDPMGVTYISAEQDRNMSEYEIRRSMLRQIVADYSVNKFDDQPYLGDIDIKILSQAMGQLFRENDWILPPK